MRIRELFIGILIAATATAVVVTGCGGSSSGASASNDCPKSSQSKTSKSSNSKPSSKFDAKGANAKIVNFGEEADAEERETASCVLEESLKARETGEWAKQCSTLSAAAVKRLEKEEVPGVSAEEGCAVTLAAAAQPVAQTKFFRKDTMTGPIDVLRVKGNLGYALYHGTRETDYSMEMEKEGDEWKVARLATTELP